MATIFQTIFANAFSWMKMYKFRLRFHWSLFRRVPLTIFQHSSDYGLVQVRRQAIIWTDDDPVYRCKYASLGLNELRIEVPFCKTLHLTHWPLGRSGNSFKAIIFKLIVQNNSLGTYNEIVLKWMPQKITYHLKSILVHVMAWRH